MRYTILAVLLLFCSTLAICQENHKVHGNLESENVFTSTTASPELNGFVYGSFNKKFGWSAFGIGSRGWSQLYAGPTYSPKTWLTLSASAGFEVTDSAGWRAGWSTWIGKGKFSLISIQEEGAKTGYWHKNVFTWKANKTVSAGVWNEFGKGTGPYAQFAGPHGFDVYVAPLVDTNGKAHMIVGAHKNF